MQFDRKDFYGDKSRWFVATVVNNRDPDALNRLQIRIRGVHSPSQVDIPQGGLPWAYTVLPVTEGGTSGIGRIAQVQPGAFVYGVFLDGETSQLPMVIGVLTQSQEQPSDVQQIAANTAGAETGVGYDGVVPPPPSTEEVNSRRFAAMRFFTTNGFTPVQAAGIVGNLEGENSGFDPTMQSSVQSTARTNTFRTDTPTGVSVDPNREPSFGIAQWNSNVGRFQQLQRFASNIGQPWDDYNTQLRFIVHELRGQPRNQDGGSSQAQAHSRLQQCTRYNGGPIDSNATWIFVSMYERPANARGALPTREGYAARAYDQFRSGVN